MLCMLILYVFFFKQKTAYEMRISDWSSDVCSSDLVRDVNIDRLQHGTIQRYAVGRERIDQCDAQMGAHHGQGRLMAADLDMPGRIGGLHQSRSQVISRKSTRLNSSH